MLPIYVIIEAMNNTTKTKKAMLFTLRLLLSMSPSYLSAIVLSTLLLLLALLPSLSFIGNILRTPSGNYYYMALAETDEINNNQCNNSNQSVSQGKNFSIYKDPILRISIQYSPSWSHVQTANFLTFVKKTGPPANFIVQKLPNLNKLPIFEFAKDKQESMLHKWPGYGVIEAMERIEINCQQGVYWTAEYYSNGQWLKSLACVVQSPDANFTIGMQYIAFATDGTYEADLPIAHQMINTLQFITSDNNDGYVENGYDNDG
jgi:hypothetical protein